MENTIVTICSMFIAKIEVTLLDITYLEHIKTEVHLEAENTEDNLKVQTEEN